MGNLFSTPEPHNQSSSNTTMAKAKYNNVLKQSQEINELKEKLKSKEEGKR